MAARNGAPLRAVAIGMQRASALGRVLQEHFKTTRNCMKKYLSLLLGTVSLTAFVTPLSFCGALTLKFDMSDLGGSLTARDVFVTFVAKNASMRILGTDDTINFSDKLYQDGLSATSRAHSLEELSSGVDIVSADSAIAYISYGGHEDISLRPFSDGEPSPARDAPRWSNFEFTYNIEGDGHGGADLTNISQFGGSLRLEALGTREPEGKEVLLGYVQNDLDTTPMFRKFAELSNHFADFLLTTSTTNGNGAVVRRFKRVIGANTYPQSLEGRTVQTPYGDYNDYLAALHARQNDPDENQRKLLTNLTNLSQPEDRVGDGAVQIDATDTTRRVTMDATYQLGYQFKDVEIIRTNTASGARDTFAVKLTGWVNYQEVAPVQGEIQVYENLSITLNADQPAPTPDSEPKLFMTNFLNRQSIVNIPDFISVEMSGWEDAIEDFGPEQVHDVLQSKIANDFSQGILAGFVGNTRVVDGRRILDRTSKEWFKDLAEEAYGAHPLGDGFYSAYGEVVHQHSSRPNADGEPIRGGVYGTPFDDRFDGVLVALTPHVTTLLVKLRPDGDLRVDPSDSLGDPSTSRKSPGRSKFEAITLERGVTHDVDFEQWANKVWNFGSGLGAEVSLQDFRKDLIIEVYNEAGQLALAYKVYRCWVSEYQAMPELDANANAVAIQTIKLENEGWERDYDVTEPSEPSFTEPA